MKSEIGAFNMSKFSGCLDLRPSLQACFDQLPDGF
jgi:hypothetical protein